jgi:hypothetical protein
MRKIIDRQVLDPQPRSSLARRDFGIRPAPVKNATLAPFQAGLFAASAKVKPAAAQKVLRALQEATQDQAEQVSSWDAWVEEVARRHPSVQVLLSHTTTDGGADALEIAADERCTVSRLTRPFVRAPGADAPLVLLLGCSTAVAERNVHTFVSLFHRNGAALVIGTVAPVLASRAAGVASAIIRTLSGSLDTPRPQPPTTLGEATLALRRRLLAEGELMALAVTVFGDTDWRLVASPGAA